MYERGLSYARKQAYADGYATGRADTPVPYQREIYPFRVEWWAGYDAGCDAREGYDDGQVDGIRRKARRAKAARTRSESRRRMARPTRAEGGGCAVGPAGIVVELGPVVAVAVHQVVSVTVAVVRNG